MNSIDLIKKMDKIGKDYYTVSDLVKITGLKRESLKVRLNRMAGKGLIVRESRALYTLPDKRGDIEKIANDLVTPSYFSFEYALSRKGLISEVPYELELAVLKSTRKRIISDVTVNYRQIKKDLFFGYEMSGSIFIAEAEKALLDTVYFMVFGKGSGFDITKVDKKKIAVSKLKKYARRYPAKTGAFLKRSGFNI